MIQSRCRKTESQRLGLPHPLINFAVKSGFHDNEYADAILEFVNDTVWAEAGTIRHEAAKWFLHYSETAFFVMCSKAGIDADRLRTHLIRREVRAARTKRVTLP
jgi:hypothetical protein